MECSCPYRAQIWWGVFSYPGFRPGLIVAALSARIAHDCALFSRIKIGCNVSVATYCHPCIGLIYSIFQFFNLSIFIRLSLDYHFPCAAVAVFHDVQALDRRRHSLSVGGITSRFRCAIVGVRVVDSCHIILHNITEILPDISAFVFIKCALGNV